MNEIKLTELNETIDKQLEEIYDLMRQIENIHKILNVMPEELQDEYEDQVVQMTELFSQTCSAMKKLLDRKFAHEMFNGIETDNRYKQIYKNIIQYV